MFTLLPLIILLVGAGLLLLGYLPRFEYTGWVAVLSAALALAAWLGLGFFLPATVTFSAWGPRALLPVGLQLRVDALAWLFGASILTVTLATMLTGVARPGGRRIIVRGAILLLTLAGVAAVATDNLITRILVWAALDLIYFLALVALGRSEGLEPQAVLNLAFNSAGTVLALAAALLVSRASADFSLRDATLQPGAMGLITLAAVFRLGLFPLHLGLPAEANLRQGLGTLLRLIPAAVALEMLSRLAGIGFAETLRPALTVLALLAAWVGAAQLWQVADARLGITYLVIAESGLALLAGLWGGALAQTALTAQALALVLGGGLVYLAGGYDTQQRWQALWPGVGMATLLGVPLTVGMSGLGNVYLELVRTGNWGIGLGMGLAQVLLSAGLWRALFWPGTLETAPPLRVAYVTGLALPALYGVTAGLSGRMLQTALSGAATGPAAGPGAWAVAGIVPLVALGAGAVLWWFEDRVRSSLTVGNQVLTALFRLDWLYRLAWGLIRLLGLLISNLAAVLEGEGALLWTLVAVVLVWLAFK